MRDGVRGRPERALLPLLIAAVLLLLGGAWGLRSLQLLHDKRHAAGAIATVEQVPLPASIAGTMYARVLPVPVGPINRMLLFCSSTLFGSCVWRMRLK